MTEQNELRERVARIICCFAVGNNNCAECEENTDPGHKFPDCFWDIRQETDQLFALYADKIEQAVKEERERILRDLLVLDGWATPEQALKSVIKALKGEK